MTVFDINVYWNVMSNILIISSSIFKSFILISGFAIFRLFEKLDVDIYIRSQNNERFKRIIQQILRKLNLEKFWIESSSDQFMKHWKKMNLMISKTRLSIRNDCSNWLLDIVTIVYNGQGTIINWEENVYHEMNSTISMLN